MAQNQVMDRIGYARVSANEQDTAAQIEALRAAGCTRVFEETVSGKGGMTRPVLDEALAVLEQGDILTVWKLNRLGRSARSLLEVLEKLQWRGIAFESLTEGLETRSAGGKMVFAIMAAMAKFERDLISERTRTGLGRAKATGSTQGRPQGLTESQKATIAELHAGGASARRLARDFRVSSATVYRLL